MWHSALCTGHTQSRKTNKTFEVLSKHLLQCTSQRDGDIIVLFITQANSVVSAQQLLNRSREYDDLLAFIPKSNMTRVADFDEKINGNVLLVDFYNIRNTREMLKIVRTYDWKHVYVIFDEADNGAYNGINNRMLLLQDIQNVSGSAKLYTLFITATIANLSNNICKIFNTNPDSFSKKSIVTKLLYETKTAHFHVEPVSSYIGPSWFLDKDNASDAFRELVFSKDCDPNEVISKAIFDIPENKKEVSLIVTSNRIENHNNDAYNIVRLGYNVVVSLNSKNVKNYKVIYNSTNNPDVTKEWNIPWKSLDKAANAGYLKEYKNLEGVTYGTGIESSCNITLSHMLQACLRVGTSSHSKILSGISIIEKSKLLAIFARIKRPRDYPKDVRLAIIAGNLASRGISIQNQMINFACTSFVFMHTKSDTQCGAINTQRLGRACGILRDIFVDQRPLLVATKKIMKDAIANEKIVNEKSQISGNGELICLKDFVTREDWKKALKDTKVLFDNDRITIKMSDAEIQKNILLLFVNLKKDTLNLSDMRNASIPIDDRKRWSLTALAEQGFVVNCGKKLGIWRITEDGKKYVNKNIANV
jgi:hypothetical protein